MRYLQRKSICWARDSVDLPEGQVGHFYNAPRVAGPSQTLPVQPRPGNMNAGSSLPLSPAACQFPKAQAIIRKAEGSWLKNTEVCELLMNYVAYNLPVSKEPPSQPPGG